MDLITQQQSPNYLYNLAHEASIQHTIMEPQATSEVSPGTLRASTGLSARGFTYRIRRGALRGLVVVA